MDKRIAILFICSGNTCRSVMAEGLFTKTWGETGTGKPATAVASAGMETIDGLAASAEALQVLREEGVDLSHHRSKSITNTLIEEADYIFTMTYRQKETLKERFPMARGKAWLLAEFAGFGRQKEISDPFGRGLQQYRRAAREIKEALERILEKLETRKK